MSDKLLVELSPARIELEPGASPVESIVTLQNLGDVVEQYTVEVVGLDPEWYTAPVASVGLFPQDRDQVRITFHPPKRPGLRAGSYPFRVKVRSRGGAQEESAEGVLDVRGYAVYRLDLAPRRQTARGRGTFRVQITNTGTADVRLALEARDAEEACRFRFTRDDTPIVAAGSKIDLPLIVQPKRRPWVGPERSFDFALTARPQDARGDPQTVAGQFTHRPLLRSWAPFRRVFIFLLVIIGLLVAGSVAVSSGVAGAFPQRLQVVRGQICGKIYTVPLLGALCPEGPKPNPVVDARCTFELGFKEIAQADEPLVGKCTTKVGYDGFGNGLQYTTNGVLFWQKESNTVYFFTNDSVYLFIEGKVRLLQGSGRR